jgi:tetratricopeptide (TPR) repeat protein
VKTLTFVTSLYDLVKRGSTEHRTFDWLFAHADFVLGLDRELVIFTDPELETELRKRRGSRRTKIVPVSFEKLLSADRVAAVARGALQRNAHRLKVTPSYVQLMWAKYAMLDMALEITSTSHLGWIDMGITHVAKLPPEGVDVFADPSDAPRVHVLRCFGKRDVDAMDYWYSVQGHLAGGLVVGARGRMRDLIDDFWNATDRAISMGLSPLDEGLLSYVVGQDPSRYAYSYGDYEDILRNHDLSRGGEGHCKWIVEDAINRGLPSMMGARSRSTLMGMYEHGFIQKVIGQYPGHVATRVVETGTCTGYSTRKLSRLYSRVDTVELGEDLAAQTQGRMTIEGYRNVHFHVGDSARVLRSIAPEIHEPCVFYLDAHWSGDETVDWASSEWKGYGVATAHRGKSGERPSSEDQVPLLAELRAICEEFPHRAIVYIDDYGLFGADGRGKWDVGFIGNDWSHLHVDDLKKVCEGRLVDWVVDSSGLQVAIVLAAADEPVEKVPRVTVVVAPPRPVASGDRPLLGLVMIVKNEAKRVASVLASYRPYIDSWTILDTGSTDGTQDLVRGELAGIPGTLHEEPFVDFATSRNRALDLHGISTVFSIMPNGDVLQGGAELRTFLEAHTRDRAGAYRVRIAPGHYYHPLVMRCGAGWRYKWRTHECAMGPDLGPQIPGVTVHRDRGQRTDAEWRQRWERDLVLLNQDREADLSDPRPYFYLGQTHECLGQYAEALPFFEQRATMGGYFDEVFEAKLRIGKMKEKIGRPWAEVQQAYLEAYAHDPRRAEPLYLISEHWYDKEIHSVARVFAVAAAKTPKPPTDLFLDEDVYTWKAADRAAISSYYAGHKDDARHWADVALRWSPDDERLRANRAFSTQSAGELFGAVARPIEFSPEPGWQASNPSIYSDGTEVRCVVRTVNYRIVNGRYVTPPDDVVRDEGPWKDWQLIRTRNFLLDLDAGLKTQCSVELVDATNTPRTTYPVHGFEDMRLFAWRGSWWATATVCDFTEDGRREIALLQFGPDGAVVRAKPLRGPWSPQAQKNWMPFVMGDVLRFIYATHPTTVFELIHAENHDHRVLHAPNASLGHGRLRGGSQGVRFDGGWIFIVHDVAFPGDGRIYLHRFVFFDADLCLVSMTPLFYFERLGIEFCAGLAQVGDKLVASYAVNDGSARLGVFDAQAVRRELRKDFVI